MSESSYSIEKNDRREHSNFQAEHCTFIAKPARHLYLIYLIFEFVLHDGVLKIMEALEEHFKGKPDYPLDQRPPV